MKLKELKRTVNVSWSPANVYPILLATGTAAQQVDASFSSTASLELYSLNLNDPSYDMELKSSLQSPHKFQKIVWSASGVLVGGCDGGLLNFYSVDRLIKGSSDALVAKSTKHNGHVSALDVNPFQSNLLSSGASDSEIYIWDLNNTSSPMAPGNKSQPSDRVQGLAWNQQVQHILASTFATRCVVWDLRKNEPIMKLSDAQSRTRWRSVAWHPSVATQLCVTSEDDQVPVVQLWDLRLAASPLVTLERHQKGVMALSWCKQDPDLLLSAGKDGTVLCWNPNNTTPGGELLSEVSSEGQWVFDVAWCPRDPCLVASASFDGHVNVHSINGGTKPNVINQRSNIMDSFPGMDSMSQMPVVTAPVSERGVPQLLPRPPRWAKRPVGAKFAFGGKLVSFDSSYSEASPQRIVFVSQIVTDPDIVQRAAQLDSVLGAQTTHGPDCAYIAEYCRKRGDSATDQNERYTWFFLKANFEPNFKSEVLNLLGFKRDDITSRFKSLGVSSGDRARDSEANSTAGGVAGLSREAHTLIERKLLNTDFPATAKDIDIPTGEDLQGLICRALVSGNLEDAVELCLEAKRISDALTIALLGSQELLCRVQNYYFASTSSDPVSVLTRTLLMSRWADFVEDVSVKSWREALATIITHCDEDNLAAQCELLGSRLSQESDASLASAAALCYLCSASVDALVAQWQHQHDTRDAEALGRLVELALLARKAAVLRNRPIQVGGSFERALTEYAMQVASQGHLQAALGILECAAHGELRERLQCSLGLVPLPRQQPAKHQANAWSSHGSRTRTNSGHQHQQQRKQSLPPQQNHVNDPYGAGPQPVVTQPWPSQAAVGPQQQAGLLQPASNNPVPPAQPPRPGSTGPQSGGLPSRSKYVIDPSVKSGPSYGQYNFNGAPQSGYGNYTGPLPANLQAASVPNVSQGYGNQGINPAPLNQGFGNPGINSAPLNQGFGNQGINPARPSQGYGNQGINPASQGISNGGYYNPTQFPPEAPPPPMAPPAPAAPAPPGWNDPPMLSSHKAQKKEAATPAPITHPLFGVEPQHIPLNNSQAGYQPQQGYPAQQQGYPAPQQAYPGPGFPGGQTGYPGQQQFPSQLSPTGYQQTEPAVAAVPEPPPKLPLPEQHVIMQTVFDALRAACVQQAQNPQMKRKLDDVHKKLETLYDMLRENRLSENALSVLHTATQQTQSGDYPAAITSLTSLAVGPDFASVASFLPGLKVLLQLASQVHVYLR